MKRAGTLVLITGLMLMVSTSYSEAESIPLIREGGVLYVPVVINDKITLNFTIDSGASDVTIPADVFSTLIRTGTIGPGDFLNKKVYQLADGSQQTSQVFTIRSLRVGNFELRNVVAAISPQSGSLLLGQSFLSRIRSWSIDNVRQVLLVNEPYSTATQVVDPPKQEEWTRIHYNSDRDWIRQLPGNGGFAQVELRGNQSRGDPIVWVAMCVSADNSDYRKIGSFSNIDAAKTATQVCPQQ
jgi:hypothetical protein